MDKPVLMIQAPKLSDEAAVICHDFFYTLIEAFEGYYYHQIERHERKEQDYDELLQTLFEGDDPF